MLYFKLLHIIITSIDLVFATKEKELRQED